MKLICGQCGQEHEMSEERFRNQFQQDLDLIIKWGGEDSFRTWLSGYTESLTDENLLIVQSELGPDGLKVFHELTEGRFFKVSHLNATQERKGPQPMNDSIFEAFKKLESLTELAGAFLQTSSYCLANKKDLAPDVRAELENTEMCFDWLYPELKGLLDGFSDKVAPEFKGLKQRIEAKEYKGFPELDDSPF